MLKYENGGAAATWFAEMARDSAPGPQPERMATLTAFSTPHPRAFARALVVGTQALRSAYIPVFRLPRLPELLLGAHRQWGLRRLLAQDELGADWVDTYTGAYRSEVLAGACHWLPERNAEELGRLLLEHLRRWDARPAVGGPAL